ncbi:hypothetical protein ACFX1S_025125 [Malus domestica]
MLSTSPEIFDRLPVISARLSVYVIDADTFGKANASPISELASSIFELASSISELRRVQRLHVTSADKFGKEDGLWFLSKPSF